MITDKDLVQFLWDKGHFWNRGFPDTQNVTQADLGVLKPTDKVVQLAVANFQKTDANLIGLSMQHHNRLPIEDGDAGPATRELATLSRCPMPDHPPPPTASFSYSDPGLQKAVETYQEWASATATGSGSWPAAGCDPQNLGYHSIRINIDLARCPAKIKAYMPESLKAVVAAYAAIGISLRYTHDGSDCEISKAFESIPGSVIGYNEFPRPNTCNQTINGRLDSDFQPDMQDWANLECHETGHGVMLEHTRGGIMNPSLLRFWPLDWTTTPSYPTLKKYFGGEPLATTPPPPTLPVPDIEHALALGDDVPAGACTITINGKTIQAAFSSAQLAGVYMLTRRLAAPPT